MPNGEGPKLVEQEDGIGAMERFQFHENDDLANMANGLVDKYFGEDYGLDDEHFTWKGISLQFMFGCCHRCRPALGG
ncbi:hypothetical protein MLD38_021567 [Melastoma candidum]|uniref:Uncharacterized protein n=1 Tax=Melastoma candidum TaxID=119954 RepID=A0ACB9QHG0_9MYRT|nr:hypothetical protein MLD38_021567 [Melastoma candidum]